MKKVLLLLFICLLITGCGSELPELDDAAIGFYTGSFVDIEDDNAGYMTFEYNGRTYMSYGTIKGIMNWGKDIDKCIGYIVQDENASQVVDLENKETRVYTLVDDKDNNFLMVYYIGTTLMNQPDFFRAIDTKGIDINIPRYIDKLDGNYWD